MKRILFVAVVVSLLALPAAARQWTTRSGGPPIEAELMDVKDGNAILQKTDGSQVSIPLNKLSLGDVRYINQELKSAEAAVTGGKVEAPSSPAERPKIDTPLAVKGKAATPAQMKKLHYDWKKGQTYVYKVRIIGERGNDTENRTGNVTYKVGSTQLDEIQLAMTSELKYDASATPRRYTLLGGRHVAFVSDVDRKKDVTVRINPQGRILESQGDAPLPYLLGDLAELVVEPLPEAEQTTWTITGDPGVVVVSLQYPYWRFSMPGFREGVPAAEKTVYTVEEGSDKYITISKRYEMSSAATLGGKPRIEATGSGKLKFDLQRSVFATLDYDMRVTVRLEQGRRDAAAHQLPVAERRGHRRGGQGSQGGQGRSRKGQARKGPAADRKGNCLRAGRSDFRRCRTNRRRRQVAGR